MGWDGQAIRRLCRRTSLDWLGRRLPDASQWVNARLCEPGTAYCRSCGQTSHHRLEKKRCPNCRRAPLGIDGIIRLGTFDGPCGQLISALKYEGWWELTKPLGTRLADAVRLAYGPDWMRGAVVVPIPSVLSRLRTGRHTRELANEMGRRGGATVSATLWRSMGKRQVGCTRSERLQARNRGWHLYPFRRQRLVGRDILLVDDVMTTGRTASLASQIIRQMEVRSVVLAVVAVTEV